MAEHLHGGTGGYATNPGQVDKASRPAEEKDESVPNPFKVPRNPVKPERGRPAGLPPHPGGQSDDSSS